MWRTLKIVVALSFAVALLAAVAWGGVWVATDIKHTIETIWQ